MAYRKLFGRRSRATTDTAVGDAAAQTYANKNLSGNSAVAPITDELTNTAVADTETLYQDEESESEPFYYVVRLEENVEHFFLPGLFDEMNAPVVAVATISKVSPDNSDNPSDPDNPDNPDDPDNPIDPDNPPEPPPIEDITGDEDPDPDPQNPTDPSNPTDPPTEEQQEIQKQEEGFSIYGALKGNPKYDRKSLEEMMTFNTWWSIYSPKDYSNVYGVYPDEGGSIYFTDKNYRTETTNINSSEVSSKKNNFSLFLDLGSDLMYVDHHSGRNGQGGLFEYSWDVSDIPTDGGDTLTSIENHAYANRLRGTNSSKGNYELTFNFKIAKTTTTTDWWGRTTTTTSYNKVSYSEGQAGIKNRVYTSFNFDATWPVRSNKTTSPKYVNQTGKAYPETDPLYIRIESEELNEADYDRQNTTVRQIFININANNMASNTRPLVIFYEGPDRALTEGYDDADVTGDQTQDPKLAYPNLTRRPSQPVILNLQADCRVILFAPSSPVIIKGNGHKLQGFVIGKNFVDFADSGTKKVTENGLTFYTDAYGNIQTKNLPQTAIRKLTTDEKPLYNDDSEDSEFKKKYYPTYEFAYNLSAFNLSDDSFYSSFGIPELERKIYNYLDNYTDATKTNAVDMIFTTIRSKWIT